MRRRKREWPLPLVSPGSSRAPSQPGSFATGPLASGLRRGTSSQRAAPPRGAARYFTEPAVIPSTICRLNTT
jgi:hypothetical protein